MSQQQNFNCNFWQEDNAKVHCAEKAHNLYLAEEQEIRVACVTRVAHCWEGSSGAWTLQMEAAPERKGEGGNETEGKDTELFRTICKPFYRLRKL